MLPATRADVIPDLPGRTQDVVRSASAIAGGTHLVARAALGVANLAVVLPWKAQTISIWFSRPLASVILPEFQA